MDLIKKFATGTNKHSTRLPSCKSINEPVAGIYIAQENMKLAGWREEEKEEVGVPHFLKTNSEEPLTKKQKLIPGRLLTEPRLLIVRGQMLALNKQTDFCEGIWIKNNIPKEDKQVYPVKRYLVFFVDPNGKAYHTKPIQLTAKGTFMYNFDMQFNQYASDCLDKDSQCYGEKLYLKDTTDDNEWYAANYIFEPKFVSRLVGTEKGKKANGCITESFGKGGKNEPTAEYRKIFDETCGWWKKSVDKKLLPSSSSLEHSPIENEENVVYEEIF